MIVDQTDWGHIRVDGEDRLRFMQGMCTANIEALQPGEWVRASVLNVKGRVMSVIEVVCREDHLLINCEPTLTDKTIELLDKHAIMDDVAFTKTETPLYRVWDDPQAVWVAPPVFAQPPEAPADLQAVEVRRIEAGMPSYGVDVSEANFPFESPLIGDIDFEKGCYLGQEPVSRVHHQGNASKALRGLRIEGDGPVEVGAQVAHPERNNAGTVTSAAVSATFGSIALAYIHRTVFEPGTEVTVAGRKAVLNALPFTE